MVTIIKTPLVGETGKWSQVGSYCRQPPGGDRDTLFFTEVCLFVCCLLLCWCFFILNVGSFVSNVPTWWILPARLPPPISHWAAGPRSCGHVVMWSCGHHSRARQLQSFSFIPEPTVVRQLKSQWVRSYLQVCSLHLLFHQRNPPSLSLPSLQNK